MASRLPKRPTPPVTPKRKSAISIFCTGCGKPTTQTFTPNQCARCKSTSYCSRSCQASDWPFHKRFCNKTIPSPTRVPSSHNPVTKPAGYKTTPPDTSDPRVMTSRGHWLGTLPELTCYHIIIDTYRLRLDAEWGNVERFCHGDHETLLTHFYEFLEGAMAVGALPKWWMEDNMIACTKVAIDETADACILHTVKELRAVVAKKYKNNEMSEQLLRVAERVYGWCEVY